MKTQIKKFNRISKIIDMADFYSITITEYNINLQGYYKSATVRKPEYNRFKLKISENGYVKGSRYNIHITLT